MADTDTATRSGSRRIISVPFDDETLDVLRSEAEREERSLAGHIRFLVAQARADRAALTP